MVGAVAIVLLGVGLRLAFLSRFPTLPFSDFAGILEFGRIFRDSGLAPDVVHWVQLNPGMSMLLSVLFRLPGDPVVQARTATAILTGLLGLLPYLLWRSKVSWGSRVLAGGALALWPGQIVFSGVVAQDNWVLVPAIALGALAVRRLRDPEGEAFPVASALLYTAAAAIRQEMLLVLLPLALPAALSSSGPRRPRDLRRAGIAAAAVLLALAAQRFAATGRFAVTTPHGGHAVFGALSPGAFAAGWVDPRPIAASIEPSILFDSEGYLASGWRLAAKEMLRRPLFHPARAAAQLLRLGVESEAELPFWALWSLPPERAEAGARLSMRLSPLLRRSLPLLQGVFLVAVLLAWRRRDAAVLALAAAVALKFALHAVASPMGRLLVPAIALQILAVALAVEPWAREPPRRRVLLAAAAVLLGVAIPALLAPIREIVLARELGPQRLYVFPLEAGQRSIFCRVERGRPAFMSWAGAALESHAYRLRRDDGAEAVCRFDGVRGPLNLRLEAERRPGATLGRARARVVVDGVEKLTWEISEASGNDARLVSIPGGPGVRRVVVTSEASPSGDPGPPPRLQALRFEFVAPPRD